jgi:hypothetical protein
MKMSIDEYDEDVYMHPIARKGKKKESPVRKSHMESQMESKSQRKLQKHIESAAHAKRLQQEKIEAIATLRRARKEKFVRNMQDQYNAARKEYGPEISWKSLYEMGFINGRIYQYFRLQEENREVKNGFYQW